ncbi:hypothetical protein D3C80_1834820 [compost metagenome]
MLHNPFAAADPDQRSRTVQLILQQLHQLLGLSQVITRRILLQISHQRSLGLLEALHIGIIVSHIEVAFCHRRVDLFQHMGQNIVGCFIITHLR